MCRRGSMRTAPRERRAAGSPRSRSGSTAASAGRAGRTSGRRRSRDADRRHAVDGAAAEDGDTDMASGGLTTLRLDDALAAAADFDEAHAELASSTCSSIWRSSAVRLPRVFWSSSARISIICAAPSGSAPPRSPETRIGRDRRNGCAAVLASDSTKAVNDNGSGTG
mgnify:CR=1 FL=1